MEYLPSYTDDLYLMHHGIKGMKWGVRRYETVGGKLTDAGKARYAKFKQDRYDKQQAKKAKREAFKEKMTSDEAKANYKKIAKGAAIAGGIIAAGAISYTVATKSMDAHQYNLAKKMATEAIKENPGFRSYTNKEKEAIQDQFTRANYNAMKTAKQQQNKATKAKVSDAMKSVTDSKAREEFKTNLQEGRYNAPKAKVVDSDTIFSARDIARNRDTAREQADYWGMKRNKARKEREADDKRRKEQLERSKRESKEFQKTYDARTKEVMESNLRMYGKNSYAYKDYVKIYGEPDWDRLSKTKADSSRNNLL